MASNDLVKEIREYAQKVGWPNILSRLAPELNDAIDEAGEHTYCPVHGGKNGDAFRIFDDFEETGGATCNTCGRFADGIATLAFVKGITQGKAMGLILADRDGNTINVEQHRKVIPERKKQGDYWLKKAQSTYNHASSIKPGGVVHQYLLSRGIPESAISPVLKECRLEYSTFHKADGSVENFGTFDVLLAPIVDENQILYNVNRTYLLKDGKKLYLQDKNGKSLDCKKRLPVDYRRSTTIVELWPATEPILGVGEGIETMLGVRAGLGIPVWATLSSNNLAGIRVPSEVSILVIFADLDEPTEQFPNGAGFHWAQIAAKKIEEKNPHVLCLVVLPPKIQSGSVDWLNVWVKLGVRGFTEIPIFKNMKR